VGKLFDLIRDDWKCWDNTHIAPASYYKAHNMYIAAENDAYSTMRMAMEERSTTKPDRINEYHEWISYYMFGEPLTELEIIYRQELAKRITA